MLALKIALRYIFSKKTHNAVNVISMVSVAGIAVATAAIVIVLSVFNGFERLAMDQVSVMAPPLEIVPASGKSIVSPDSIAAGLEALCPGGVAVPVVADQGLAVVGDMQMPVELKGVPGRWYGMSGFAAAVIDGEEPAGGSDGAWSRAALSVGAAVKLKAHPGAYEFLCVYAPRRKRRVNPANPYAAFRGDSLVVSSVFQTGHAGDDEHTVIIPIEVARRLLDYDGAATSIELWGVDPSRKGDVEAFLSSMGGTGLKVLTRAEQQSSTFAMISVEKWITFLMLAFILLIASFNIISTLSLLMIEKSGNIGILRAMGAPPAMITRVFILEGWLVTFMGGVTGMAAGVILTLAQQWGGFVKLGGDPARMVVDSYPVRLEALDLLTVLLLVGVIGLLTSVFTITASRRS